MSEPPIDFTRTGESPAEAESAPLTEHIPQPEQEASASPFIGSVLSLAGLILLAFILRLAVPQEDNAVELGLLLIAVGFAQVWLIFYFLKNFRR
ncbi:hypothetical protein [Prosthecobacter vanneervenii]|uniref:Uncharacterized protein n=1 Tax=Prosthecobacter vanneervenii TaxID=48466 RepID=A0A7W7YFS9_9BACT|nr:hypothetical protein [Prosthecobacter vanneervenii]MBB5035362.1 hypothetical protein [Prosthecobacter vanneervenii]